MSTAKPGEAGEAARVEVLAERADRLRSFVALAYETGRVVCAPNTFGAVVKMLDALEPTGGTRRVQIDVHPHVAPGTVLTGSAVAAPADRRDDSAARAAGGE